MKMTNKIENLTQRIEELESKITFQDDTIEQLNQSLIGQQNKFNQLTRVIERLTQQLQDIEQPNNQNSAQEIPPHY